MRGSAPRACVSGPGGGRRSPTEHDSAENRCPSSASSTLSPSAGTIWRAPALDDCPHGFLGLLLGSAGPSLAQDLRPRNRDPLQRAPVFDDVDDAPVRVVANRRLCNALDRAPVVERRGENLPGLTDEVESPLSFDRPSRRVALGRQQPLALLLRPLPLADVDEQGLRVERLPSGPRIVVTSSRTQTTPPPRASIRYSALLGAAPAVRLFTPARTSSLSSACRSFEKSSGSSCHSAGE